MTDDDLRSRLAALTATVEHIRAAVDQAAKDRRDGQRELQVVVTDIDRRVTRLEATLVPRDVVEQNTIHAAEDRAVADERARAGQVLRASIGTIAAVAGGIGGVVGTIVAIVVAYANGGAP